MTRLRSVFLVLCAIAAVWAVFVLLTGGFELQFGAIRLLSSRRPRNPALISLLTGLCAWVLSAREARRLPARLAPLVAAVAAVSVVLVGLLRGAFVAGGADAYGYVSQAHLWSIGKLHVEQPFVRDMQWPFAAGALTPLGYRLAADGTSIVPVFSPGYPMVMGVFERLGGRNSVFYVVPLLGGLAVWATYLMGAQLAGRTVGVSSAILLATSPPFLFQLMFPMSDVPVIAWWALTLALLLLERRDAALAAGLAAGAAILTRVNLMPIVTVPGALLVWQVGRARTVTGPAAQRDPVRRRRPTRMYRRRDHQPATLWVSAAFRTEPGGLALWLGEPLAKSHVLPSLADRDADAGGAAGLCRTDFDGVASF